jgi:hypothetical protein
MTNESNQPKQPEDVLAYVLNELVEIMASMASMWATSAFARIPRSHAAVAEFKRNNPCQVNGARRGSCPGWQVDHVIALCSGGPDQPSNMQWLSQSDQRAEGIGFTAC